MLELQGVFAFLKSWYNVQGRLILHPRSRYQPKHWWNEKYVASKSGNYTCSVLGLANTQSWTWFSNVWKVVGALTQWLAPPQEVNKKLVTFQNVGGQETVSKYICHLGNIIAYFDMKNHEILSF